jgi:two-component system phosphate regulon sensor histidine kinase PhoR
MKKVLPIITILISLSLLGLIFFQFLWIKSAHDAKNKQVEENIVRSMRDAGERLTSDNGTIIPLPQKNDLLFSGDNKIQLQPFRLSVMQRYTKEEITEIIRAEFNKNNLKHYPFEFAVVENSITGKQMLTENFYKLYQDSANNQNHVIPLIPPSK